MKNFEDFLDRVCLLAGVDIFCFADDRFWDYREYVNYNPIRTNKNFRESLLRAADTQEEPLIIVDPHEVIFVCVRQNVGREKDAYFTLGPVALKRKSKVELHYYYKDYGMKKGIENPLPVLNFTKILELTELVAGILTEIFYTHDQLIKANHLEASFKHSLEEEQTKFAVRTDDFLHHTYEEERRILNAVREGRTEDAIDLSMAIDGTVGTMSKKELPQWQKNVAVSIALCTRAAIEGGIFPREAYQISDFYNQKCDECKNVGELLDCRNLAIRDLTERVRDKQSRTAKSSYVEMCCDFIEKHYREKIHLEDIADHLGLNPSYLSRIFSQEMGMKMQDYIIRERVGHAANMLKYSELKISEIGDYVNFPSQSYFGKMFKKYMEMTPAKYRNLYRPKEFTKKW